jgi:hypothetical protein
MFQVGNEMKMNEVERIEKEAMVAYLKIHIREHYTNVN